VALAYSVAMSLWLVPHIVWCLHGTAISPRDLVAAIARPFLSGIAAAILTFGALRYAGPELGALPRLVLGGGTLLTVYLVMLLFVLGQRAFYSDLLRGLRRSAGGGSLSAESLSNTGPVS
jgi:PST family polysaccharide transporter